MKYDFKIYRLLLIVGLQGEINMAYINTYTKEEQKALAIEKVKRTLEKINTDVLSLFNNSTFPDYLEFVANFHYFDVNNTILIYQQKTDATFVASFKTWERLSFDCWGDVNRPVFASSQKGKGIGILVPYILKKQAVSYFDYHVVFVFDKEQTNGIPVPVVPWDLSKSKTDSRALYDAFREKAPFNIVFTETEEQTHRFKYIQSTGNGKDELILNRSDQDNHFLLCSYIMRHFVVQDLRKRLTDCSEDELQKICECVSFIVSAYFGLPTNKDIFFFVKYWCGNDPKIMIKTLNTVQTHAHRLIEVLEEEMVFQKDMNNNDIFDDEDIFELSSMCKL